MPCAFDIRRLTCYILGRHGFVVQWLFSSSPSLHQTDVGFYKRPITSMFISTLHIRQTLVGAHRAPRNDTLYLWQNRIGVAVIVNSSFIMRWVVWLDRVLGFLSGIMVLIVLVYCLRNNCRAFQISQHNSSNLLILCFAFPPPPTHPANFAVSRFCCHTEHSKLHKHTASGTFQRNCGGVSSSLPVVVSIVFSLSWSQSTVRSTNWPNSRLILLQSVKKSENVTLL